MGISKLMDVEELSCYLKITSRTVRNMLAKKEIPALRAGKQWRFDMDQIQEWLQENGINPSSSKERSPVNRKCFKK